MDTELYEVKAKTSSCSAHLTFEQYLRTQVDAARKALENGTSLDQNDLGLPIEELIIELAEKQLPEIRSDFELLGFIYFLVTFDSCDPGFYQAAEELWEMFETARDEAR
jgi:hypothetical protein